MDNSRVGGGNPAKATRTLGVDGTGGSGGTELQAARCSYGVLLLEIITGERPERGRWANPRCAITQTHKHTALSLLYSYTPPSGRLSFEDMHVLPLRGAPFTKFKFIVAFPELLPVLIPGRKMLMNLAAS